MIRREPFAEAGLQRFTRELANSVRSAQNRPAKGMLRPEAAGENFVQQRFRIVEIHLDLFENYLTFFGHVVGIEERTKTQVGNNIERNGEMIVENFGVEANLFFGGEGVEHSADRIHFTGDGFGGTALRAFEDHVLHEMREAVLFAGFAAGTVAYPDADGDRAYVAHGLRNDHQAVG